MSGWSTLTGDAVVLPQENIDTDQLIPARFMSTPRKQGYGPFLLHDLRAAGEVSLPQTAQVLLAGRNFGSGSSREAAVYALVDYGIRAVLAPSFGDIFASNAVNNGLAPIQLAAERIAALAGAQGAITVDLDAGEVRRGNHKETFTLAPVWRQKLINGWDDIDLTGAHAADIQDFRTSRAISHPWAFPRVGAR
jgi:3-isopropylmalate/(R)-2-methylmalate dehydratase small subunit